MGKNSIGCARRLLSVQTRLSGRRPHNVPCRSGPAWQVCTFDREVSREAQSKRFSEAPPLAGCDPRRAAATVGRHPGARTVTRDGLLVARGTPSRGSGVRTPTRRTIACRSARLPTASSSIKAAANPSKWGIVKNALGWAARTASFSPRSATRTARIGPSGGVASRKRRMSALLNGLSKRKPYRPRTTCDCRSARLRSPPGGPRPCAPLRREPPWLGTYRLRRTASDAHERRLRPT